MKKNKRVAIIFCIFTGLFMGGCQSQKLEDQMRENQVLKINNQGDFSSLHPHTGIDLQCRIFQKALFEGLTRIDLEGKPILAAAERVDISLSQTQYVFKLREAFWTNGQPVTARHFENAWKKAIASDSQCLRADLFYSIKNAQQAKKNELPLEKVGVKAIDDRTLSVELEHPTPYFLDLISNPLFSPLYDDEDIPTIFNGPFTLALWEHDKQLVLEKNFKYWDASSVELKKIDVSLVSDPNTALLMYEKGELDWIGHPFTHLPHDGIHRLEKSQNFVSQPIAGVYWLCLNTESFPLNSVNLRKALSVVLNRKEIAKHVLLGETPTKNIIPSTMKLTNDDPYPDNNIKLAKKYFDKALKELNLTQDTFPTLTLSYSDIAGQKKLVEVVSEKWEKALGIKVELTGSEWNVFFANLGTRQFQIGGCIWFSAYNDPMYTLEFFKQKGHRYNAAIWENAYFKELLTMADFETDFTIRNQHLREAESLFLEEMPVIPLFVYHSKYLKSPKIKNLIVNDLGQVDFKWAFLQK